jgi:DNA invertase Pin-like site-specific DNA recombinase
MRQSQTDANTRTVAYIRVSTDKQADRGVSLEAQDAKVRAYAELYGLDLVDVIVDAGESAKSLERPGLQRALGMLKAGAAEALLVVKLDRLTRSVRDLGELVERYFSKAALLSVSEQVDTRTPAGRLVLNVLGAVSQWEREAIGERTAAAMAHKASRGEYIGGEAPFGYRVIDGRRLEHGEEQAIIREARALRAAGLSLRAVASRLHEMGHRSRTGKAFAAMQVARMTA